LSQARLCLPRGRLHAGATSEPSVVLAGPRDGALVIVIFSAAQEDEAGEGEKERQEGEG